MTLGKRVAVGYLWNLFTKWANRLVGLVSTLFLVRLLAPADFGVVALASIVLAFFVMLSDAGTEKYLIKADECSTEMLNSAWSLNILLKGACGAIVALFSHQIAAFMHEPVLVNVLLVASLIPVIGAFKNVGLVQYERELNYKPLMQFSVSVKLAVLPITLGLAWYLENYWALIAGLVASEVLTVIGSYLIHPFRPRWSRHLWRHQWSFSQWHLLSMTSGYVRARIDAFLLGRYLAAGDVGIYRVSQEFAWLPFTELISPATNSMYAGLTQIRDDSKALHTGILSYLALSYLLVIPCVFGLYALSDLFTAVLLGDKWTQAAPVIGLLGFLMLSMPLNICLQTVLTSQAKIQYLVIIDLIMISLIVGLLVGLAANGTLELLAYTQYRAWLVGVFIVLLAVFYRFLLSLDTMKLLRVMLLPVLPAWLMMLAVSSIEPLLPFPPMVNLLTLAVIGGAIFVSIMSFALILFKQRLPEYAFIFTVINKVLPSVSR
ncbi:oligosaccharide flippase family protein [Enterovibrio paralichthyis]|uniref:oligosaccharide flippase family protein n=1 Tax=Enterovibrio paralichthyis TaxID=2853805 RepID=UPI001C45B8A1|nr:oligosaccharide flippase family protein [Enterovibrio paralichthyis]MBV7299790.1 oligosaccharide flippase family protein [Enterovibrio paralichthyis]